MNAKRALAAAQLLLMSRHPLMGALVVRQLSPCNTNQRIPLTGS